MCETNVVVTECPQCGFHQRVEVSKWDAPEDASIECLWCEAQRLYLIFYRRLLGMGFSHEDAEERLQEVYIEIWKTLVRYEKRGTPVERPIALFWTIFRRVCSNWWKKYQKTVPFNQAKEEPVDRDPDGETRAIFGDMEKILLKCWKEKLTPEQQIAFFRYFVEGYTQKEIADDFGYSLNTVKEWFKISKASSPWARVLECVKKKRLFPDD